MSVKQMLIFLSLEASFPMIDKEKSIRDNEFSRNPTGKPTVFVSIQEA